MLVRILRAALVTLLLIAVVELAELAAERRVESPPSSGVATEGAEPELPTAAEVDMSESAASPVLTR